GWNLSATGGLTPSHRLSGIVDAVGNSILPPQRAKVDDLATAPKSREISATGRLTISRHLSGIVDGLGIATLAPQRAKVDDLATAPKSREISATGRLTISRHLSGIVDGLGIATLAPQRAKVADLATAPQGRAIGAIGGLAQSHHLSGIVYAVGIARRIAGQGRKFSDGKALCIRPRLPARVRAPMTSRCGHAGLVLLDQGRPDARGCAGRAGPGSAAPTTHRASRRWCSAPRLAAVRRSSWPRP